MSDLDSESLLGPATVTVPNSFVRPPGQGASDRAHFELVRSARAPLIGGGAVHTSLRALKQRCTLDQDEEGQVLQRPAFGHQTNKPPR